MMTELAAEEIRRSCDPNLFNCETSAEMQALDTIVGQARAVRALHFGLGIHGLGFNTYVSGAPGTGKETAVKRFLEEVARTQPVPSDWCYVNNFKEPYRPNALRLPAGGARAFQLDMQELVHNAQRDISNAFESEEYAAKREEAARELQQQQETLVNRLNARAEQDGFMIKLTPIGLMAIALKDGSPLSDKEFAALPPEEQQAISQKREKLQIELQSILRQGKELERSVAKSLKNLDREVALFALNHLVEDLEDKYRDLPEIVAYLEEVKRDILENLSDFRSDGPTDSPAPLAGMLDKKQVFNKYSVNVLVDNSGLKGAPVVIELNPTYNNLFGRIDKEAQFGTMVTDFTMIRQGCLHRANKGYLVLPVEEVLRNLFSWDSLKRALRNREITIEEAGERLGFITTQSLRPEAIPLDIKVLLIGQPLLYHLLHAYDKDFSELFKVKADFDTRMERTEEHSRNYAAFAASLCHEEKLRHLNRPALAKIVEYGSRLAEDQEKLSTKFSDLADVIREASYYATQRQTPTITEHEIRQAIEEKFYRSNLLQERIREMIARNTLLIDVTGEAVGQVNGLSVVSLGDISFGQPNRITATIGLGPEGLVDIEREAELSGPIHTKGVLILAGYLTECYAQTRPLSLSARLVFEQNYGGVEGDSAASAELYALISSLANLPVKQAIAVTGSINQKGQVQAIGGVNEKVEGFYEVCRVKGLTGAQGVIIPASNITNLMLKEEVVEAVKTGYFHVWPVKTVDEGLEILTGLPAGSRQPDGAFDEGSVSYRVDQRLGSLAEAAKAFAARQA
jgi:lon-related putative ATP-dependent protease